MGLRKIDERRERGGKFRATLRLVGGGVAGRTRQVGARGKIPFTHAGDNHRAYVIARGGFF